MSENMSSGEKDRPCGIGSFRPAFIQKLAKVEVFVAMYSLACLISQTLQAYVGSQIPSIERQFGLKSFHSGLIMAFNDIGFMVACIIATPLARFVHVPRVLFGCIVLYGVCGVLCSVPHFISSADGSLSSVSASASLLQEDNSNSSTALSNMPLCFVKGSNYSDEKCSQDNSDEESLFITISSSMRNTFLAIFGIGMILQGASKAPRWAFVTVYIDNGGYKKKTGLFMGIMIGLSIGGPVLAYIVGGIFSRMYVTLEDVTISVRDPRWIGAWWLGFLVFGIASVFFAIPLLFFPRNLDRKSPIITQQESATLVTKKDKLKDRLFSFWRVLTNPVFFCLLTSRTIQMGSIAGYVPFLSKYIQTQFNIPLWQANITTAISNMTAVCVGSIISGVMTRKLGLNPRKTVGLLLVLYCVYVLCFLSGFFLGCEQQTILGADSMDVLSCSDACECDSSDAFPVCGSNGITYQSPCYAGCLESKESGKVFENCTCIPDGTATPGECVSDCNKFYPFAVMSFITGLIGALQISPGIVVLIRCVDDRDKSTAIGLQTFCDSLFAWMPSPIIFGKIIDTTCLIWQQSCGAEGACLIYDIHDYRIKLHLFALCYKLVSLLLLASVFWRVRRWIEWPQITKLNTLEGGREMTDMSSKESADTRQ